MESFITKDGKRLRRGYTTGSCAAAAAKAAAMMLLGGAPVASVHLMTPRGVALTLDVTDVVHGEDFVSCGVVKDSGDDPDVTNGITIYARVFRAGGPGEIRIEGGEGVGVVTKPGLDQPVGNAAINSTPRRMIAEALRGAAERFGYSGGLTAVISAPGGKEIAQRTFNPRLGIVGGISILGTTGIVDPMSDEAVVETIRAELSMRAAEGHRNVLFVPGNYGADFLRDSLAVDPDVAVTTSNYIGDAFTIAAELHFDGALLVGHIGKVVKLAGGLFNTHSRWGDCRAEIFAAHAGACGAPAEIVRRILDSAMTDDMLAILDEVGLRVAVMKRVTERIDDQLSHRPIGEMAAGVLVFSNVHGTLGKTPHADALLASIREEYAV